MYKRKALSCMVTYRCRHCSTEIGMIPFASVQETIAELERTDRRFLHRTEEGTVEVRCICDQCEQSLREFPEYYTVEKWLQ